MSSYSDDIQVILSSNVEGNSYSPLSGYNDGWYEADTTWSGDFYDIQNVYDEPEEYPEVDHLPKAVVLYPVK